MPTSPLRSRLNANQAKIFRFVKERASVKLAREAAAAKKRKHAFAKIAQVQKKTRFLLKKLRGSSITITNSQYKSFPKPVS